MKYANPGQRRNLKKQADTFEYVSVLKEMAEEGREQVFALVTKVQRKGRVLAPGDFWWEFFARVWVRLIPLRPLLVRAYGLLH